MKTLKPFLYLLVVFAIVLSACKKNVHEIVDDPDQLIVELRNFDELVVPADFDWQMNMISANTLKAGGFHYYPASGYSTLAFEDLWPSKGDFDFNDLVVEYQFRTATDASNYITEIVGTFIIRAAGAGTKNGFGFELTGLDTAGFVVSGSSLTAGYTYHTDGWENGQEFPVVIVADDVTEHMPLWSNTQGYDPNPKPPAVLQINIMPRHSEIYVDSLDFLIDKDNFNPFLIIDFENEGRGKEVHKLDYPPTDLADQSFFGQHDDYSTTGSTSTFFGDSYYKTSNNFPWVLDIPSDVMAPTMDNSVFRYPTEGSDINWAYLHFADWAESGGTLYGSSPPSIPDTEWWIKTTAGYRNPLNIYAPQ